MRRLCYILCVASIVAVILAIVTTVVIIATFRMYYNLFSSHLYYCSLFKILAKTTVSTTTETMTIGASRFYCWNTGNLL